MASVVCSCNKVCAAAETVELVNPRMRAKIDVTIEMYPAAAKGWPPTVWLSALESPTKVSATAATISPTEIIYILE